MLKISPERIEKLILAVSLICAVLLITAGLFERIELIKADSENVALIKALNELTEENKRLHIAYEMAFDLAETEKYAKTVLGMSRPELSQITEIQYDFISGDEEANGDKNKDRISIFKP